jgi:predicted component of type VI protein secretion system
VIGGFVGGFIFNGLAMLMGGDAISRCVGQILMGALIALFMRVVQDVLKSAWLLGISAGPSEGKEYPLNTERVSVGRADDNDISLFREESVQPHMGALNFQNGQWWWKGESILVNSNAQTNVVLESGDTLQLGAVRFRFKTKSAENSKSPVVVPDAVSPMTMAPREDLQPQKESTPYFAADVATRLPSQNVQTAFALMLSGGQMLRLPGTSAPINLGRAPDNHLVLPDSVVSSSHASLRVVDGHLSIFDLDSTNGTFVNGVKIPPHLPYALEPGDQIRFGNIETVVRSI